MARTAEEIELDITNVKIAMASTSSSIKIDDMTEVFKTTSELQEYLYILNRELRELETGSSTPVVFSAKRRGF